MDAIRETGQLCNGAAGELPFEELSKVVRIGAQGICVQNGDNHIAVIRDALIVKAITFEIGQLSEKETRHAVQVGRRMIDPDYLNLHSDIRPSTPMRTLKVAASAFIHAQEHDWSGYRIRASFRVRDDTIEQAVLDSSPAIDWQHQQTSLRGSPLKHWRERLDRIQPSV